MKKENLEKCKSIAKNLLYSDINKTNIDFIISHPFFTTKMFPYHENICDGKGLNFSYLNLENQEDLEKARRHMSKIIDDCKSYMEILLLIHKPYYPCFFKFTYEFLDEKEFAENLKFIWISVEFPNKDANISKSNFKKLFKSANKKYLMDKEEKEKFDSLPDEITIYRGSHSKEDYKSLSWTLNRDIACFFATRWNTSKDKYLFTAKINKKYVLTYINDRNEQEVIVDYNKINHLFTSII